MKKNKEKQQQEAAEELKAQMEAQKKAVETAVVTRFGADYDRWKKDFAPRQLNILTVEDKLAVLRPVGASEVATFSMMVANPEIGLDKASEYLLGELWLGGDMELQEDEDYFISAMLQLQNVVELKKSNFYRL